MEVARDFSWPVLAAEIAASLRTLVRHRGFPSVVTMSGIPKREDAGKLRDELVLRSQRLEASWGKAAKAAVRFTVALREGKSEAGGYDVVFGVERSGKVVIP